jgi:hypothetical protein
MDSPRKNTPVFAADIPAVPDTGCILIAGGFLTWICVAGVVLLLISVLNFGKIMAGINRNVLFPAFCQLMDKKHTDHERSAFSNAFMQYTDVMYYHGVTRSNAWTITVMTNILIAAQDNVLSRSESSNFVASVEARSTSDGPRENK